MGHEALDASIFWTNVTKNTIADAQFPGYTPVGIASNMPAVPRMLGLRMNYTF
jgi:hypothetical protein